MILEGLVTTLGDAGPHLAPMGPLFGPDPRRFTLKPFRTSTTYRNLMAHPEGVLHVTDDVLLLARAAVGRAVPFPDCLPADTVRGVRLTECCRALEFRVTSVDESGERAELQCEVSHLSTVREFFGLNRAMYAVLECAILATRLHLLPPDQVAAEFARHQILVAKTGGPREAEAFAFLDDYRANANLGAT